MPNYSETGFRSQETVLHDYRNGKERPWKEKKKLNEHYADILSVLKSLKTARVSDCASILRFAITDTGHYKLKQSFFCKSRLCPICAWRRSMKYAVNVSEIVEEAVKRKPKGRWIFLTLTTKNTTNAKDLSKEISEYSVALRKMLNRKVLSNTVLGYSRGIEVTVNKEDGSYNQHMHVLLLVKSSYFNGKKNYVDQSEWIQLWKKAMKLDYEPSVHIEEVKGKDKDERFKAILEVAKYPVKSFDYLSSEADFRDNARVVDDLEQALYRKRLTAFGGLLKDIQKKLNLEDVESENADLVHTGENVEQEQETGAEIVATWDNWNKNYYIKDYYI